MESAIEASAMEAALADVLSERWRIADREVARCGRDVERLGALLAQNHEAVVVCGPPLVRAWESAALARETMCAVARAAAEDRAIVRPGIVAALARPTDAYKLRAFVAAAFAAFGGDRTAGEAYARDCVIVCSAEEVDRRRVEARTRGDARAAHARRVLAELPRPIAWREGFAPEAELVALALEGAPPSDPWSARWGADHPAWGMWAQRRRAAFAAVLLAGSAAPDLLAPALEIHLRTAFDPEALARDRAPAELAADVAREIWRLARELTS